MKASAPGDRRIDDRSAEFPPAGDVPTPEVRARPALSAGARLAVWLVRQYQRWLGPIVGGRCRFYPSCSQYAIEAIGKYGVFRGTMKSFWRICKCQPFHPGGVDHP